VLHNKNMCFKIKGEGNVILKPLKKYRCNLLFLLFTLILFLKFKLNPFHINKFTKTANKQDLEDEMNEHELFFVWKNFPP